MAITAERISNAPIQEDAFLIRTAKTDSTAMPTHATCTGAVSRTMTVQREVTAPWTGTVILMEDVFKTRTALMDLSAIR